VENDDDAGNDGKMPSFGRRKRTLTRVTIHAEKSWNW
jgi:hypothetical protein